MAKSSRKIKKPAIIAGVAVVAIAAFGGAAYLNAEATNAKYPVVSQQVQDYYDTQVSASPTVKTFEPAPNAVAFIGDSYSAGTGADKDKGFVNVVSQRLGLSPANFAQGGTGYIKRIDAKGEGACGRDVCLNYGEMADKVIVNHPAAVVVSGGRNDPADPAAFDAAAVALFNELRAGLPKAKIIATSPIWAADAPPAQAEAMRQSVRAAVTAVGGTYVDLGDPLTGHREWVTKDNVHPNNAGHEVLADAVLRGFTASQVTFG